MYWVAALLLVAAMGGSHAQLTAQSSVAPELRECYANVTLVNRNNLPPMTMPVLIDIIRKIEDNPNNNMDMRQLAVLLLHTYRQDGIEFHLQQNLGTNVLPYAPTFHSFQRHRLLLTRVIPGNLQVLGNDTISSELKCALHYMLSTTVDARVRGDENNCNQLSQYRALRTARQTYSVDDDVELLDPSLLNAGKNGQMRQYNPNDDVDITTYGNSQYERQLEGDSQCPLLGGVVNTAWGAVSAGHLIAGIAAGSQSQQVPLLDLIKGSSVNFPNVQQSVTAIFPATMSGDLAEAVLIQGTERGSSSIQVGATGNWNSTQAPRYFMLGTRNNVEMTDPEIRGDLDGFVLGLNSNAFNSLSLSQVLDMFYAPMNGVLNPDLRACNRRVLSETYVAETTLATETYAFAAALDTNLVLRGTFTGSLDQLVTNAVTGFRSYVGNNLNDLNCITTESTSRNFRLRTNLYVVIDSTWQYQTVYPAISHLVDVIEVCKFGSSITLLSASDGNLVVNKTFSIADFHTEYTLARHLSITGASNLLSALTNIRIQMHNELEREKIINYVGGNSTVLLFLLNNGNLQLNEQIMEQARIFNETIPDLRMLFATTTNQVEHLWPLVRNMHDDIMTVALTSTGTNVEVTMAQVADRIRTTGRRIINPACGSDFKEQTLSGTRQFDDFVEPGYINFYSISANYFYVSHNTRRIRISRTNTGTGNLIVCHSRTISQPRQNSTIQGVDDMAITCQSLTGGSETEISLRDACDDFSTISSCPPFFISVQSSTAGQAATTVVCNDHACRFPYSLRYQVTAEELGCFSSAGGVGASLMFIITAFTFHVFRWM